MHRLINYSLFISFFTPLPRARRAKEAEGQIILNCKRNFNNLNVVLDEEQSHLPQHTDHNLFGSEDLCWKLVDE